MVTLGGATSMLLAEGNDFCKDAIYTSTVEWRPDMRDSIFTIRSLIAISQIDSIWNLGMRDKPLTSNTNLRRFCFCVKMVIHAKLSSSLACPMIIGYDFLKNLSANLNFENEICVMKQPTVKTRTNEFLGIIVNNNIQGKQTTIQFNPRVEHIHLEDYDTSEDQKQQLIRLINKHEMCF